MCRVLRYGVCEGLFVGVDVLASKLRVRHADIGSVTQIIVSIALGDANRREPRFELSADMKQIRATRKELPVLSPCREEGVGGDIRLTPPPLHHDLPAAAPPMTQEVAPVVPQQVQQEGVAGEVTSGESSSDFKYFTAHLPCLRKGPNRQKIGIQIEVFEVGPPSIAEVAPDGAVAEYNARCVFQNSEDAICENDQLLEVNGAAWDTEIGSLLSNLRSDETLCMVLRRKRSATT